MSFYGKDTGEAFAPGWFLANQEDCTRVTCMVGGDEYHGGTVREINGRRIVPMGSLFPNTSTPSGIIYEDIDVTDGAKPASVVVVGTVYTDRVEEGSQVSTIEYIDTPEIERPY